MGEYFFGRSPHDRTWKETKWKTALAVNTKGWIRTNYLRDMSPTLILISFFGINKTQKIKSTLYSLNIRLIVFIIAMNRFAACVLSDSDGARTRDLLRDRQTRWPTSLQSHKKVLGDQPQIFTVLLLSGKNLSEILPFQFLWHQQIDFLFHWKMFMPV